MRIVYDVEVTEEDRAAVETWVVAHESDVIDYITIGLGSVVVHGPDARHHASRSGFAVRYTGRTTGALDEALATLRSKV